MSALLIPGSPGELVDKITILEIKAAKISEKVKQSNILYELGVLMKSYEENITVSDKLTDLKRELKKVNESLWDIDCLLYTSPSPRDQRGSRMPSSA